VVFLIKKGKKIGSKEKAMPYVSVNSLRKHSDEKNKQTNKQKTTFFHFERQNINYLCLPHHYVHSSHWFCVSIEFCTLLLTLSIHCNLGVIYLCRHFYLIRVKYLSGLKNSAILLTTTSEFSWGQVTFHSHLLDG